MIPSRSHRGRAGRARRAFAVSVTAPLLALAIVWGPAPAEAQNVRPEQWRQGYHGFAALSRAVGVTPTDDLRAWLETDPRRSLLVVFGSVQQLPWQLQEYLEAGGAVLLASDRGPRVGAPLGIDMVPGPLEVLRGSSSFQGFRDCPIVSDFPTEHPISDGVRSLITNRPGALSGLGGAEWTPVGRFPALTTRIQTGNPPRLTRYPFLAAAREVGPGRIVVLSDQSLFTNQMLVRGDNARLAMNILRWLNDGRRDSMIIQESNAVLAPPPPVDVELELPPPTPQQVRDALRNLPPDVLVEFANTVLAGIEDDEVHNQFAAFLINELSWRDYWRLLIFLVTALLAVFALRGILPFGIAAETVSGVVPADRGRNRKRQFHRERSSAARQLLAAFRSEFEGASDLSWNQFVRRITMTRQPWRTFRLRRRIKKLTRRLHPRYDRYWSRSRLAQLQSEVARWRDWQRQGELTVRTE